MGRSIRPGDGADDVDVLEERDASRAAEVRGRPGQSLCSSDGDPGLAGLEHHHHRVDVRDGDACVFTETPSDESRRKAGE